MAAQRHWAPEQTWVYPFSNRKRIRGWKRRARHVRTYRDACLDLDVGALRQRERARVPLNIDPWDRLVRRNPPVWYRRLFLASLFDVYESWRHTLEGIGQPYYLRVWLAHPRFFETQLVAAIGSRIAYYEQLFVPDPDTHAPPAFYAPDERFASYAWRRCSNIQPYEIDTDEPISEHRQRQLDRLRVSEPVASAQGTTYLLRLGDVYVGHKPDGAKPARFEAGA